LAGAGQSAANQTGAFGAAATANAANLGMQQANSTNQGNTDMLNSAIYGATGAYNNYRQNQIIKAQQPTYSGGGGGWGGDLAGGTPLG
jgi:hypothetical protein